MKIIPLTKLDTMTIKECIECEANRPTVEYVHVMMKLKRELHRKRLGLEPEEEHDGQLSGPYS